MGSLYGLLFSDSKMWRWVAVWQLIVLLVSGMLDTSLFTMIRQSTLPETNCIDLSKFNSNRLGRSFAEEKRPSKYYVVIPVTRHMDVTPQNQIFRTKRFDHFLPDNEEIVREHAKLVQDINSLRQLVFVPPLGSNSQDYDEPIFHEIIETTTTARPSYGLIDMKSKRTNSIPIVLLGGASQRYSFKKSPVTSFKPTYSLVGTTISPVKPPYPFVMQASSRIPMKVCVTPIPITYSATTRKPSLWEKLLKTILPR